MSPADKKVQREKALEFQKLYIQHCTQIIRADVINKGQMLDKERRAYLEELMLLKLEKEFDI